VSSGDSFSTTRGKEPTVEVAGEEKEHWLSVHVIKQIVHDLEVGVECPACGVLVERIALEAHIQEDHGGRRTPRRPKVTAFDKAMRRNIERPLQGGRWNPR
jgi:hypothetical protein